MNYSIIRRPSLHFSFAVLMLLAAAMGTATFAVYFKGTAYGNQHFYHSLWFISLWLLLAVAGGTAVLLNVSKRKWPVIIVHFSLIWILFGAFLTHFTGKEGMLPLSKGVEACSFTDGRGGEPVSLPFRILLTDCGVDYYPGSASIEDYRATLQITDGTKKFELPLSMNHIAEYRGYRFCMNHFMQNFSGIVVTASYDRWGMPVSYSGYLLFSVAMVWLLLSRGSRYRAIIHKVTKYMLLLGFLGWGSPHLMAARVVDRAAARELGRLQVVYNGRIAPVNTLAADFAVKLTGTKSPEGLTADQFFWSWVFYFDDWKKEPVITIDYAGLRDHLKMGRCIPLTHLFSRRDGYSLNPLLNHAQTVKPNKLQQAAIRLNEKVELCMMLHKGELLNMFPYDADGRGEWLSPADWRPHMMGAKEERFVRNIFPLLQRLINAHDREALRQAVAKFHYFQEVHSRGHLLSRRKVETERFYNSLSLLPFLYRFCLLAGAIGLVGLLYLLIRKEQSGAQRSSCAGRLWHFYRLLLFPIALVLLALLGLRWYITGHIPLSNGYESMLTIAFSALILGLFISRKIRIVASLTYLVSGFFLLVASLSFSNPQITHLMPVLESPLLSLHVSVIMIAYALLSFSFLVSFCSLLLRIFRKEEELQTMMKHLSLLFIYPALLLLGAGIFIGAVWANISWGSYWSWDAKEVWALITLLVYSLTVHDRIIRWLSRPLLFHFYVCIAVSTVLMTYFGVNYLLGGMHSYA